ncbi:hypothetical protein RND71_011840 [Anisodus tanguticus]|uniref:Uncharacterized protein n=1 Tax=Anisodus tanguticus TaxID=243964 RepID=A0AAE1VFE9_9SOLA|nr:hypothetical protein RND71_011840 [Anisodus tanguticus]
MFSKVQKLKCSKERKRQNARCCSLPVLSNVSCLSTVFYYFPVPSIQYFLHCGEWESTHSEDSSIEAICTSDPSNSVQLAIDIQ